MIYSKVIQTNIFLILWIKIINQTINNNIIKINMINNKYKKNNNYLI